MQSATSTKMPFLCSPEEACECIRSQGTVGINTIIVGNCLNVLPLLPDESVDLIHTSPPYNIGKEYTGFDDARSLWEYREFLGKVIQECYRVLKPNGSFFFQSGYSEEDRYSREIYPIDMLSYDLFKDAGFKLWDRIIWHYFGGMSFSRKFKNNHETILWWVRPGPGQLAPYFDVDAVRERTRSYDKRNNLWGKNPGNVWIEDRVAYGSNRRDTTHIAVYPEGITERIIRACSQPGWVVLDPFAGSGTTPMMARALGRKWVGIEISPVYAREAASRVGSRQPGEAWNLASCILKVEGFENNHRRLPACVLATKLRVWLDSCPLDEWHRTWEEQIAKTGLGNGPQSDEGKDRKPEVWAYFDELFSNPPNRLRQLVVASRLLDALYPQRRVWNNVRKYKHTLDLIARLRDDASQGEQFVAALASEEPSSYSLEETWVYFHGKPVEPWQEASKNGQQKDNGHGQVSVFS